METFSFTLTLDDIETNQKFRETMKKVLRVIKSMNSREQFEATRRYIDLWYRKYGETNKGLIEIYFKSKKNEVL